MFFDLTDEQEHLQDTIRQLLESTCPISRVREIFDADQGHGHDPDLWHQLASLGLLGITVPEQYGGAELELLDLAMVAEVLGRHATPGPFFAHALACIALTDGGSDEQKERWLPRLAAGEIIGSVALLEAGRGWQPENWTLDLDAPLRGTKQSVPAGGIAGLIVVGGSNGRLGLVDLESGGIEIKPSAGVDQSRRIDELVFDGARAEVLPGEGVAARVRDAGLVLLAADAYGGASYCVDASVEHAKTREQFGVSIGHFQALKHQLADMAVAIEPCRALYWYAAHAHSHIPLEAERSAAIAKAHVCDQFMQTARDAVEAFGGIGYTWECEIQMYFKRAMFDRAFLGLPGIHRERSAQLDGW